MPFEFLKENLARRLISEGRKSILSPQFCSLRITNDDEMCCYLAAVMSLLENCARSMLPALNPKSARFDYSEKLGRDMLDCADEFPISAPLEKVALQEPERDFLLGLAIRTRKDGNFTYNDVFMTPRPYSEIFRLIQASRSAQFARMKDRAQGSGFTPPRDSIAATMAIAPLWFFGESELKPDQETFLKSVLSSLVSIVQEQCVERTGSGR